MVDSPKTDYYSSLPYNIHHTPSSLIAATLIDSDDYDFVVKADADAKSGAGNCSTFQNDRLVASDEVRSGW